MIVRASVVSISAKLALSSQLPEDAAESGEIRSCRSGVQRAMKCHGAYRWTDIDMVSFFLSPFNHTPDHSRERVAMQSQ